MLPYLHLFGRDIPLYGLSAMLGLVLALCYLKATQPKHTPLNADTELALIWGCIGALVGAKLLYLATVLPDFLHDLPLLRQAPRDFLARYLLGGFVFYGGLFGALLAAFLYCRTSRISFSAVLTQLLPVIPLIHAFGRIGCFCSGCCYGRPSQRFGIAFSHALAAPNGVKLLPVQLYEAATTLGLFVLLAVLRRRGTPGRQMLAVYFLLYGVIRFVLEFFRGDRYRGFVGVLSISQVLSLVVVVLALVLLFPRRRAVRQ